MQRFLLLCTLALALFAFSYDAPAENKEVLRLLSLFGDVFEKVREDYVEEVPDEKLIESAVNGMLTSLDPHSSYLNKKAFDEMQVQTKGEFGGLGIEVTMENGVVKVVSPLDETPAAKAGILPGDYISYIDNEPVMGMLLSEAVEKMRGRAGSKITLTILRKDLKEPLDITLTRAVIKIQTARSKLFDDIGYVRLTSFSEQTAKGLKQEFESLKKQSSQNDKPLKGLVLDLRNNPGGLLDQAIAVASSFLNQGEVVSTRGRHPESTKRYNVNGEDITKNLPVVVLINSGSASASEIVAGALQDHKRAVIMGTKSFGKGSVQTVIPLPHNAAMRLTTARYYTPSGHSIQAKGIVPDIVVEPAKIEFVKTSSREDAEASLRGHLANPEEAKKAKEEKDAAPAPMTFPVPEKKENEPKSDGKESKKDKDKDKDKDPRKALYDQDYQLARAIDLLKAVNVFGKAAVLGKPGVAELKAPVTAQ